MSSSNPPAAPKDQFAGTQASAVNNAFSGIQQFGAQPNTPQQTYQQFQPAFSGANVNTGYDPTNTVNAGNWMTGQAQSMSPYVSQLFQMGFDPQNAAYGLAQHNNQEQARAGNEARGIDMTPYGAGVENKSNSDFNIDWQNTALQRAVTGAQGATGVQQGINQGVTGGQNLAEGAGTWQGQIAQMLSQLGIAGQQQPQNTIQDWLNYTNQGTQSAGQQYQGQFQNWNAQQQANNSMFSGLGSLAGSVLGGPIGGQIGNWAGGLISSDRDIKYDIGPVDDMLVDRLMATPIDSWRYNWESPDEPRHIGPMAQDLKKNFGVGTGRAYLPVDGIGLSLAVAKVLAKKVRHLERRAA